MKLTELRPQTDIATAHTPRGMGVLEQSIQTDGWIGAITVAADGETFDGSARLEVGAAAGFEDAIVVESDGSHPVVVKRTDIATAADPRAVRLGIAANRVEELYQEDGRLRMARSLQEQHPDVTTIAWKWGRWQHVVDYRPFKGNTPRLRPGVVIPDEPNNYGMVLKKRDGATRRGSEGETQS